MHDQELTKTLMCWFLSMFEYLKVAIAVVADDAELTLDFASRLLREVLRMSDRGAAKKWHGLCITCTI